MRISRENMGGTRSERYGEGIISELADELTQKYGKGFDKRSLYRYVQFYQSYPDIVGIITPQSGEHAMIVQDSDLKKEGVDSRQHLDVDN